MTWWGTHVRPRDLFVTLATVVLAALAIVVWTSAATVADQARAGVIGGIITTFGTLIGYYLGNRGAESAVEAADLERNRASRLETEIAKARAVVAHLEAASEDVVDIAPTDPDSLSREGE